MQSISVICAIVFLYISIKVGIKNDRLRKEIDELQADYDKLWSVDNHFVEWVKNRLNGGCDDEKERENTAGD